MNVILAYLTRQTGRLTVLVAFTMALSGCAGINGFPHFSQVRFIHASPDMPALDIYQGASVLAYNVGFGGATSYVPGAPGVYTFSVDSAGTRQQLAGVKGALQVGGQYTVLLGSVAANAQMTVLPPDQSTPSAAGQVGLRFVDQSTRAGAVDLYMVTPGSRLTSVSPIATNVSFGGNTGYLSVPSGTYSVVAMPAGTLASGIVSPLYTGIQVSYSGGEARTLVLIDQQPVTTPGVQVITVDDYDPTFATT